MAFSQSAVGSSGGLNSIVVQVHVIANETPVHRSNLNKILKHFLPTSRCWKANGSVTLPVVEEWTRNGCTTKFNKDFFSTMIKGW